MPASDRYRITAAMFNAGVKALDQCRQVQGCTPETACETVFYAMLDAADIHPGASLAKSFALSPHDDKPRQKAAPHPAKRYTRADFDENGRRKVMNRDGTSYTMYIESYWYLREAFRKEKNPEMTKP